MMNVCGNGLRHRYYVAEFIEGKQTPRHHGDSFDRAIAIYDRLMDASFLATRNERAVVSCIKRDGRTRTVVY